MYIYPPSLLDKCTMGKSKHEGGDVVHSTERSTKKIISNE